MGIETTASKLSKILETKAAIKQSITNKGVSIPEGTVFGEYPALIDSIEVGSGGSGSDYENPDFYEIRTNGGTNYCRLFSGVTQLPDLSTWDTSNVTRMDGMFLNCEALDYHADSYIKLDLSNFDVSNVTTMDSMFNLNSKLYTLDITGWDTSKVTTMKQMFYNCSALSKITGELDLSRLTEGCYSSSSIYNMFYGCTNLYRVYLKNIYKNCYMTNVAKWSIDLGKTKVVDECLIYIINELPDLINDKGLTATDKIVLTLPTTNTLTQEQVQVAIDKGWSVANTTY